MRTMNNRDYSVDFHAHILPNADHGSSSIDTSLKQVEMAVNSGIDAIVATPHYYDNKDTVDDFLLRRENAFNLLDEQIKEKGFNITILKGAEVNLQVDLFDNDLRKLCIGNSNFMLLEMPMNVNWTKWHYDAIDELIALGINPVIAHIDRYSSYYLEKIFEKDVYFQVNIEAFTSFGSRQRIKKFFKQGNANLIGSDIHGVSKNPYEIMQKYRKKYPNMFKRFDINALSVISN